MSTQPFTALRRGTFLRIAAREAQSRPLLLRGPLLHRHYKQGPHILFRGNSTVPSHLAAGTTRCYYSRSPNGKSSIRWLIEPRCVTIFQVDEDRHYGHRPNRVCLVSQTNDTAYTGNQPARSLWQPYTLSLPTRPTTFSTGGEFAFL